MLSVEQRRISLKYLVQVKSPRIKEHEYELDGDVETGYLLLGDGRYILFSKDGYMLNYGDEENEFNHGGSKEDFEDTHWGIEYLKGVYFVMSTRR